MKLKWRWLGLTTAPASAKYDRAFFLKAGSNLTDGRLLMDAESITEYECLGHPIERNCLNTRQTA